jgi:hypothetical protein
MAMTEETRPIFAVGTEVVVFSRFRQDWIDGFEVAAVRGDGYSLRRQVDWAVLPGVFAADDLRVTHSVTA